MAEIPATSQLKRRIRSFVRREGRLTPAQQRALDVLWPRYGLTPEIPLQPQAVYPGSAPLILEIGFGNGESLVQMAATYPQFNYLGIEVHRPGVGHLLLELEKRGLDNVRVYCADAVEVLETAIGAELCQRINIFFPDPWPKKRHHKRRLIQPAFVALLAEKLQPGGILHLATDWPDYARHMRAAVATCPRLVSTDVTARIPPRPQTKYERRGRRLGHPVTDLAYRRL
ncbi:tRNA (guanine-N7-)-methyltransferase [Methylomarinovum caldicuralii]|uniref:tRNA (guanine-N(7)-)-methyltransferase n=1 Tax=Methylomarinovum caldicuralii TaxID=438856 RepID=A0AAU9BUZ3_9GAMM|nr:tRNA (guanosine(46)-N7)-methyltransferase TrmB [Methylomarinovum caldicuralii]BCX82526.1 tRNA (guanine-N7-)-methyltransferase [Methylomarinovum caldicuralii]